MSSSNSTSTGIGIGTALAMILSWTKWHDILWVLIHGFLGWIYVIYYVLSY